MYSRPCLFILALAAACEPGPPADQGPPQDAPPPIPGYPAQVSPCLGEPAAPTRLLITTTDFSTGGVSLVDLATFTATPDLALGSSDARPRFFSDLAFVLHRYGVDALDLLAPDDLHLLAQRAIITPRALNANPHDLVVDPEGRGYITLFGAPEVQVWDLRDPNAPVRERSIDISPVADADGNPEASEALLCGNLLFFAVDRVDQTQGLVPVDPSARIAVLDLASGALHDLDPDTPGAQPIVLRGQWARQWRLDPSDPGGRSALLLTTGVERLDLSTGTSEWALTPERMRAAGIDDYRLPQAFDLGPSPDHIYLAAYRSDFSEVALFRADLDRDTPLVELVAGLQSVEQTLEVVGDVLYFGDRSHGTSGLRAWDLTQDPPALLPGSPLPLGLAPYAATAIP